MLVKFDQWVAISNKTFFPVDKFPFPHSLGVATFSQYFYKLHLQRDGGKWLSLNLIWSGRRSESKQWLELQPIYPIKVSCQQKQRRRRRPKKCRKLRTRKKKFPPVPEMEVDIEDKKRNWNHKIITDFRTQLTDKFTPIQWFSPHINVVWGGLF